MADGRDGRVGEDHARAHRPVRRWRGRRGRGSTSAATRAWYLPAWVSRARPLTSPMAYSQSEPADAHPVVDLDRLAGLDPECLEAHVGRVGAASDGDEQLVARPGPRRSPARAGPASRRARPRSPWRRGGPPRRAARRPSSTSSEANSSSRAISRGSASTIATEAPERGVGLRHLDPDDAAAEDEQAAGDRGGRRHLPVRPRRRLGQPRDRRQQRARAGGHDHGAPRLEQRRRRRARGARPPGGRARAPASTPRDSSQGSCAESSRSWMTSSRRASTRGTSTVASSSCTPGTRCTSSTRSPGRSSALEGMHA